VIATVYVTGSAVPAATCEAAFAEIGRLVARAATA
jgi:hypothetical protein